jgi:hypothetical protein|tara:strand:+ start:731 stop:940 length:210 start_codon:yes stop_codon:yes gene_type:complete
MNNHVETSFTYTPTESDTFLFEMLSHFAKQLSVTYVINDDNSITFSCDNPNYLEECYDQLNRNDVLGTF